MSKKMLINATYPEECRIAVIENDYLVELEVERQDQVQLKGNIYRAPISRVEPSLQAAFLDIGSSRNGFLQINDINPACYYQAPKESSQGRRGRPSVKDILRPGQELVVQVVKDERAAKGATLTTNLSIPGRYLVMMVGNQRGGVSRKIQDESQRRRLKETIEGLKIPAGIGIIVRTAGINKGLPELQRDLDSLLDTWYTILEQSLSQTNSPLVLYKESSLAIRTIRDYLSPDIEEIIIDNKEVYDEVCEFIAKTSSKLEIEIKYYEKQTPLFSEYHLDTQIEATNASEVTLPSGGSIVINSTEAVVAIDVNSGRATSQADVEETAFQTNKEAAIEVARQLRLRDLGGLVVIDFIDMGDRRHKANVEKSLKDSIRHDKAKVEIGRISKFGLLEMSRQRLKSSLVSTSHETCPQCQGRGKIRSAESISIEALRRVQSAAFAGGISEVRLHISPVAGLMLLNSKRRELARFEEATSVEIKIYPDGRLRPEEFHIEVKRSVDEKTEDKAPAQRSESSDRNGNDRQSRGRGRRRNDNRQRRRGGNRDSRGRNNRQNPNQDPRRNSPQGENLVANPTAESSKSQQDGQQSGGASAPSPSVKPKESSSNESSVPKSEPTGTASSPTTTP